MLMVLLRNMGFHTRPVAVEWVRGGQILIYFEGITYKILLGMNVMFEERE